MHPDIAISHLNTYLCAALGSDTTYTQIAEMLDTSEASISRGIKQMSKYRKSGTEEVQGYDLLYITPDLMERRRNVINLTAKGKKLKQELINILEGED